jgi:DNA-binding CsgD family transcriptional regulator
MVRKIGSTAVSPRMFDCLELAALGNTRSQVACKLGISVGSVRTYLSRAFRALGAGSLLQALAQAEQRFPEFMATPPIMEIAEKKNALENLPVEILDVRMEGNRVRIELVIRLALPMMRTGDGRWETGKTEDG